MKASQSQQGFEQRRILIAIDKGEPSRWAIETGGQLAGELGGRVMLVHVVKPQLGITDDFVTGQRLDAQHLKEGEVLLAEAQRFLPASMEAEQRQPEGAPVEEILRAAREWNADMIVMGTRGQGPVHDLILGSTAQDVVRKSPCPVVTVAHAPRVRPVAADEESAVSKVKPARVPTPKSSPSRRTGTVHGGAAV